MKKRIMVILMILVALFAASGGTASGGSVPVKVTDSIFGKCESCDEKGSNCTCDVEVGNLQKFFTDYIQPILNVAATIGGLIAVLFIVYGGIMWMMSDLDPGMKNDAKKIIFAALTGLAILFLAGSALVIIAPWAYD